MKKLYKTGRGKEERQTKNEMDKWCREGFEELGCGYLENKGTRAGWLETDFRNFYGDLKKAVDISRTSYTKFRTLYYTMLASLPLQK
jgi:hypothetical protein